jgi:hypothetical protein
MVISYRHILFGCMLGMLTSFILKTAPAGGSSGDLTILSPNAEIIAVAQERIASPEKVVLISITTTPPATPTAFRSHTPMPSPSITPIPIPVSTSTPSPAQSREPVTGQQLDSWFDTYAGRYSIDRSLLHRIAVCESNLNPDAVNGPYGGLFQFSQNSWISTRRAMNEDSDVTLRFDAEEAIKTAAFKISVGGVGAWPNCSR